MTSKMVSFLSNIKDRKEGIEMLNAIKKQVEKENEHNEYIECHECGEKMNVSQSSYVHHYQVGNDPKEITILNAPHYECKNCNNELIDVLLYADVEKVIEEEIFLRLNNRQEIPDKVEFNEFIN